MVTRCANPECSRPFLYFREGRLFSIELEEEARHCGVTAADEFRSSRHGTEFFWLCADCSRQLTLRCRRTDGKLKIVVEPISPLSPQYSKQNEKEDFYEAA